MALEGEISKESVQKSLSRGVRASGDLIPWTISQQFQDDAFPGLSGARIVRIATHPDYQSMGYGRRALELLTNYYEGRCVSLAETAAKPARAPAAAAAATAAGDVLEPRKNTPPLLARLDEVPAEHLDYLGVSFGVTGPLFKFWSTNRFAPVYVRQTEVGRTHVAAWGARVWM